LYLELFRSNFLRNFKNNFERSDQDKLSAGYQPPLAQCCLLNHPWLEDFVRLRTKSPSKGGEFWGSWKGTKDEKRKTKDERRKTKEVIVIVIVIVKNNSVPLCLYITPQRHTPK